MTRTKDITTWLRERDGWSPRMEQAADEIDNLRADLAALQQDYEGQHWELKDLRAIVRLVNEHLSHEMQYVPLTPELSDAYSRVVRQEAIEANRTEDRS